MSMADNEVESMNEDGTCPSCGDDNIETDPPYAECNECGWQGRI